MKNVRQIPGDRPRRIYSDESLEVVVWYEPAGAIYGFQICYDPRGRPRALTWRQGHGFSHAEVDDGEQSVLSNRTPTLRLAGDPETALLRKAFADAAGSLPLPERNCITDKLEELPDK